MSGFPRLNLVGVQISKQLTQKLTRKPKIPNVIKHPVFNNRVQGVQSVKSTRSVPNVSGANTVDSDPEKHSKLLKWKLKVLKKIPYFLFRYRLFVVILCVMVCLFLFFTKAAKTGMLRRIQRVHCSEKRGVFVCDSKYSTGTMIISVSPLCRRYIYEINGVPFVRIDDFYTTIRIPATEKLVIRDARPGCKLSVHRTTSTCAQQPRSGIVWVTTKKHSQFTMTINGVQVLEETPVDLLDSKANGEWIAYMFNPEIPLAMPDVQIRGDSSDPIYVYI